MSIPKIVEITHAYIRDFPIDACARDMSEEKLTCQGLICAKICLCMHELPLPQSNKLA